MSDSDKQLLVHVATGQRVGRAKGAKGDVDFPDAVRGWVDVLDARHGRYIGMTIDEIRTIAEHVHKPYILVRA